MYGRLVRFRSCRALSPDFFYVLFSTGIRTQPLVDRHVHRPVIAVEVRMMKLMKVVAGSRPLKPVVAEPSTDSAVDNAADGDCGVASEGHGYETRGVVQSTLDGMHVGTTPSSRIVALVMKRVHMIIEKFANIWNSVHFPWMHHAMNAPEMWNAPVGDGESPHQSA